MSGKLPSFPFYPGDWLRDDVSGCSWSAQGLWLRMMIMMHDTERYGHAILNGKPMPPETIARRCGGSVKEFNECISELENAGVFSRTEDGIIYSRRMVRDALARENNAERQRRFYQKNTKPNGEPNANITATSRNSNAQPNGNLTPNLTDIQQKPNSASSFSSSTDPREPMVPLGTGIPTTAPKGARKKQSDEKTPGLQDLMKFLHETIGPISDGAAQGAAIKWLLKTYTVEECKACLEELRATWTKGRISWLIVQTHIGTWKDRQKNGHSAHPQPSSFQPQGAQSNGNQRPKTAAERDAQNRKDAADLIAEFERELASRQNPT